MAIYVAYSDISSLPIDHSGIQNRTTRVCIPGAKIPPYRGYRVRLKVKSASGTSSGILQSVWIGTQKSEWLFNGDQVQITFNGGSTSLEFNGAEEVTSDWVRFNIQPDKNLILSVYSPDSGTLNAASEALVNFAFTAWIGGEDQSSLNETSGWWTKDDRRLDLISWIEVGYVPFEEEPTYYFDAITNTWKKSLDPDPFVPVSVGSWALNYVPPTYSDSVMGSAINEPANVGFCDDGFTVINDGPVLRGRYAVVRHLGVDTEIYGIEYTPDEVTSTARDYERYSSIGLNNYGFTTDEDASDEKWRFVCAEDIKPYLYTLELNREYSHDASKLSLTTIIPALKPITPRYERDSDVGEGGVWQYAGQFVEEDLSFADYKDGGDRLLADRMFLLDPDVSEPMTLGISFADLSRVGIPVNYGELQIDLKGVENANSAFVGDYYAEFEQFLVDEDTTAIDQAFRAVVEAKALRDTVAVSFETKRPVAFGDYLTDETTFGEWVAEAL